MKISDLEKDSKVPTLVATIDSIEPVGETPGGTKRQEGILSDDTGQVKLTLWGEQTGQFAIGDKISISNGWCKEFEGTLQISTGKFGRIALVPKEKPE